MVPAVGTIRPRSTVYMVWPRPRPRPRPRPVPDLGLYRPRTGSGFSPAFGLTSSLTSPIPYPDRGEPKASRGQAEAGPRTLVRGQAGGRSEVRCPDLSTI